MERPRFKAPDAMWAAIVGGVVAYDTLCRPGETLSERMDTYLEHKTGRYITYAAVGMTALHLTNILPDRFDLIHQLTKLKKAKAPESTQ